MKIVTMGRDAAASSRTAEPPGPPPRSAPFEILAPYQAISMRCDAISIRARSAAAVDEVCFLLVIFRTHAHQACPEKQNFRRMPYEWTQPLRARLLDPAQC
jgi:hypothetical protein